MCYNKPDAKSRVWSVDAESKMLTWDEKMYQVNPLTAILVELQQELTSVDGKVIEKS